MVDLPANTLEAAALIVAVCALYLTIQSNKTAQKHNRLSVKPRLTSSAMTSRTSYFDGSTKTVEFRFLLTNVGLGPAVVKTSQVMLDGKEEPAESFEDVQRLLEKLFPGVQLGVAGSFFKLDKEHAVEVGREVELVAFEVLNPSAEFDKEIKRVSLRICCESLYEETLVYDTRDHHAP